MGGKQPGPSRTAWLSAGKEARSSVSKPLRAQRGERCRYGAPELLETLLGVGIPGEGNAESSLPSTFQLRSASIRG